MKKALTILIISCAVAIPAMAQLAGAGLAEKGRDNATVAKLLENETSQKKAGKTIKERIAEYENELKKNITQANIAASKEFLAKTRQQDPFGGPLRTPIKESSPNQQANAAKDADAAARAAAESTAFENAVRKLVVGALNASKKEFLIGSDNIFEGDAFDMQDDSQQYRIWVKEVTDEYIALVDNQTGAVCEIRLNFDSRPPTRAIWGARSTTTNMPSQF